MEEHIVRIKSLQCITHDVLQIIAEKPEHYNFNPGQATDVSINKNGWRDLLRSFTFTSPPDWDFLQFTIKTYPARNGVTNQLRQLKVNDELILHEVFGAIAYKGEGIFIAGGAGVTPFICIFRHLYSQYEIGNNKLIFANKTSDDIILKEEFNKMLGDNFINILSEEKNDRYHNGFITKDFLKTYITGSDQKIYVCGPPPMMDAIGKLLTDLNVDEGRITKEAD